VPARSSSAGAPVSRLVSLDAYRGFVMLLMASGGLGIAQYIKASHAQGIWPDVRYHFDHVDWRGGGLWDMIQPSFTFIVGVALPFSLAKRRSQGQSFGWLTFHAVIRSVILICLGFFLRSLHKSQTNFTFEDTLTQIGLGYTFAFMLSWTKPRWQVVAVIAILVGYWLAFALHPLPPADFKYETVSVTAQWRAEHPLPGFTAHWEKNTNAAAAFDVWFLNLFSRAERFAFNRGGYQTLSFIPTLATMLLGLLAGELMISRQRPWKKVLWLLLAGGAGVAGGWALDRFGICPNVKRIWTPSWVLFSGGWACLLLALFYTVVDWAGQRWIAFPAVVVGMNSIAMYCLADGGFEKYIRENFHTHLGTHFFEQIDTLADHAIQFGYSQFGHSPPTRTLTFGPIAESAAALLVLWLICLWMYRRKIFLRI